MQAKLLSCIGAKGIDPGTKLNQAQSEDFSTAQDTANVSSSASSFQSEKFINSRVTLLTATVQFTGVAKQVAAGLQKKLVATVAARAAKP